MSPGVGLGLLATLLVACTTGGSPGPYSDPEGVQLPLWSSLAETGRLCSDPVFKERAMHCCGDHDLCCALGPQGTPWGEPISDRSAFHACNHDFAACLYRSGMPGWMVRARFRAVESNLGWDAWRQ